jgi:hypothetical protein
MPNVGQNFLTREELSNSEGNESKIETDFSAEK